MVPSSPEADLLRLGEGDRERDRFKPSLAPAKDDAVDLAIGVPLEVVEGLYATRLNLKGTGGVLVAHLPIQFQVVH